MVEKLKEFDPAKFLKSDEAIRTFIEDAFETKDAALIADCIGIVARAKGMTKIAEQTGLSREQLYRSFSQEGNPTLTTTLAVMDAIGFDLAGKPHSTH